MNWFNHGFCVTCRSSEKRHAAFRRTSGTGYPDAIWAQAIGMRNILVHRYFDLDPDAVREAVQGSIQYIKRKAVAILAEEE